MSLNSAGRDENASPRLATVRSTSRMMLGRLLVLVFGKSFGETP